MAIQDTTKLIEEIIEQDTITEKQIRLLSRRVNHLSTEKSYVFPYDSIELNLEPEQTKKGLNWLKNHAFTKSGAIRKTCILGVRELSIIENYQKITFVGYSEDILNYFLHSKLYYYYPVYRVYFKTQHFDYYVKASKPVIIV